MPYWRLSGFYLFYFATLGALIPYWSVYLQSLQFSATEIGELMAILMATKIVAPLLWGWIADRTRLGLALIHWANLLGVLSFSFVIVMRGYWNLAIAMAVFSFFWNAALPQIEAITLNHLGNRLQRYTRVRLWGSIGFIFSVVIMGIALESLHPKLIPYSVLVLMLGIWLAGMAVPAAQIPSQVLQSDSLWRILKRPEVIALFCVCMLMQASHGPYYAFYTLYMAGFGYSKSIIGQLWALGVACEVLVFLIMYRLVPRYGLRAIFIISLFLAAVRWFLIGFSPQLLWLQIFAQTLHAASFGTYHAVAIQLIHRLFIGKLQVRGQALYSSLSFGAGGALGSYYSGYIWDEVSPAMIYYIAALLSLIAFMIAIKWINKQSY